MRGFTSQWGEGFRPSPSVGQREVVLTKSNNSIFISGPLTHERCVLILVVSIPCCSAYFLPKIAPKIWATFPCALLLGSSETPGCWQHFVLLLRERITSFILEEQNIVTEFCWVCFLVCFFFFFAHNSCPESCQKKPFVS